jgi:hypothetical protein
MQFCAISAPLRDLIYGSFAKEEAAITRGLEWVEKSLKLNQESPDSIAMQGSLLLLQARSESNPEERKRHATAAAAALEKAIEMNSFLRNEYEPLLKEAKALSSK